MNEDKDDLLESVDKDLNQHIAMAEELLDYTDNVSNKQSEAPDLNSKDITSDDLIPANILSEPRFAAFGAGPIETAQDTVTETMSKSVRNTADKVDTVSTVSSDKAEGSIEDGYKPTLEQGNETNTEGVEALEEAKNNVEGGNGVAIVSNTEVQVSSFNTFSINSGRVGTIQSPLLVSQASSNIDYSEVKTIINNLQNERSRYRYAESHRDINVTNKDLRVAQSSEERVLRKSLEAVQSYDETSALIARNSEKDTTITDNRESYTTQDDIQQAQKGGIHFVIGSSANPTNTPALFRPILPGEFNPMEQTLWSMKGGKIEATSTHEFNLKTGKSNTTAKNIGLIAKDNLSSIASNNGVYGDMTTMIGKKALSTGTDLLSMTTMIGKFTFMGGFLSVLHQILDSDISRVAQIILPRIKLPTNLPIPPLPPKASAYTETDLRKCLPNYEDDTIAGYESDDGLNRPLDSLDFSGSNDGGLVIPTFEELDDLGGNTQPASNGDIITGSQSNDMNPSNASTNNPRRAEPNASINTPPTRTETRTELNKEKAVNNEIIPASSDSGPPSSVSWKEAQTSTESVTTESVTTETTTTSSSTSTTDTFKQSQGGVDLTHKTAFTPNTYLEIYQLKPLKFNNFNEPPVDDPNSTVKEGIQALTLNFLNEELKKDEILTDIDKKILEDRAKSMEVFEALQRGEIPEDLTDNQKAFLERVLESLSITVGIGAISIPGIIKSVIPDTVSRFIDKVTQVGDKLLNRVNINTNDLISNLKEGKKEALIGIGKSALGAIQSGDITGIKGKLNELMLDIFQEQDGIVPTFSSLSNPLDGNVLRDIIIPPDLYGDISPILVSYILEPESSIESIESLVRTTLRDYFGDRTDKAESIYRRISPLIKKVKDGNILDLISKGNLRNTVSTLGGDSLVNQVDSVIDNIESIIGTTRSIQAIPALLKLMNEENIPTLSKVSTILSCLDLADRISDLIGIVKSPLSYKPKAEIPEVFTFFDEIEPVDETLFKDIDTEEGTVSSIYNDYSAKLNPYMDTALVTQQPTCAPPQLTNIPSNEIVRTTSGDKDSSLGFITYPKPNKSISLSEFITMVKESLVDNEFLISINSDTEEQLAPIEKDSFFTKAREYPDTYEINIYY